MFRLYLKNKKFPDKLSNKQYYGYNHHIEFFGPSIIYSDNVNYEPTRRNKRPIYRLSIQNA